MNRLTDTREILILMGQRARLVKRDTGKAYLTDLPMNDLTITVDGNTANGLIRAGYVIEEYRDGDYPMLGKRYGISERGKEVLAFVPGGGRLKIHLRC